MVDRIVEAGRAVLVRDGYDGFSTNRIAAQAGISPGSLYQYFPDKAAILAVVIERWSSEVSDRVSAALADRVGERDPAMLRRVLDALLTALEDDAALLRVVMQELPSARSHPGRLALERRVQEMTAAFLAGSALAHPARAQGTPASLGLETVAERPPRPPATPGAPGPVAVSWVLVLAVEQLAVRWVLDDDPPLTREQIVIEMERLCSAYFLASLGTR